MRRVSIGFILGLMAAVAMAADAQPSAHDPVIARVNEQPISFSGFREAVTQAIRQKFYHGEIPEGETRKVIHETLRAQIDAKLYAAEAKRRGIRPDPEQVQKAIDDYDRQYRLRPNWPEMRARALPLLQTRLESDSVVAQLEAEVRAEVPDPKEADIRTFYDRNPELFTEPERVALSLIQLTVDPSSPGSVWKAAETEGERIRAEILGGASFEEMARKYSSHPSAERRGGLGYVHQGMMPDADKHVASIKQGQLTPVFRALEGVMILRLDERVPPAKRAYKDVRLRAAELLKRERSDAAWESFRSSLYDAANVTVDAKLAPELADFPLPRRRK